MRNALGIAVVMAVFFSMACSSLTKHLANGRTVYGETDREALEEKDYIEGYVLDSKTKKGIEGAIVEVKNANMGVGYYRLTTDSDGYFRIDDFIKHIRYAIEVVADGYVTSISTEKIRGGKYTVYLDREGILTGTVRDSSGQPLKGVEIRLKGDFGHMARTDAVTHMTDGSGRYRFDKLKEAAYTVTFRGAGYITETARIKKIKSGETFTLPMMMLKPSTIAGTVVIQGIKTPAINVDITLKGRTTHSTSTFQDGSYFITDIKPGYYKIHLSHRGFYKFVTGTIRIREGMKRENYNFTVRPKPPKVSVYAYRYTFSPGTKVAFNIRTFRLEKVRMRIYSVPMGLLLNGRTDPNRIRPADAGLRVVDQWDEAVRNFKPYEWRYSSIGARKPLSTGGYCIEILGAGKTYDRKFFTVTSVGVVVKRSRDSIFAYVTDLVSNRPVAGAQIVVFDNTPKKKEYRQSNTPHKPPERIEDLPVKIISTGKTDSNGIYHLRKRSTLHLSLLAIHPDRSYAFCSTGHPYVFKSELNKYFIYTDRPVYRAGDTVFYKIVGKSRGKRFTPIRNRRLNYQISNIDFDEGVDDGELLLDAWGTGHGKLKLAADTHLGTYELRVGEDPDNLYGVGRFYVEQYRKPEFTIEITPSRDYYVNGDTAEFKVEAKYFFGAPLKGALLRYRFYETKLRDTDTVYWWEEDYGSTSYFNRIKLEGEKYADDSGITVLRIHCGDYPYDREITLEVTAVDKSNVSITSRKGVTVGRGAFYIKINPRKNFFADDEKKRVAIKTITYSGKPVRTKVRVQLFRYIWKPWERVYVHSEKPLFEREVNTTEKGLYTLELPKKFDVYGEFDIVATARDSRDNAITASRVLWIYSRSGARVASRFKNLELTVNRSRLTRAGDITCLLKSRFSDASVCLTLEGRDIYESRVVRMAGNIMPVTMRIKSDYAPNLFITATMQRKRALFTTSTEITLPNPDTSLSIGIRTDKKQYLPGEKARVTMKVTDEKGKPVQADLSLGGVDEAIYQIRPDHTPRMVDFFYSKISNWVMTNYSYPITLLAGMSKEKKVKVREKFRDTAYWNPTIRTGQDGTAKIAFTLPDNLTTWVVRAVGATRDTLVGEETTEILVTKPLLVRPVTPRFLVIGDRVRFAAVVSNQTEDDLSVEVTFGAVGLSLEDPAVQTVEIPAGGETTVTWWATVPNVESADVIFSAVSGELSDAARPRLTLGPDGTLPVLRYTARETVGTAGQLTEEGSRIEALAMPETFDPAMTQLRVRVEPSLAAAMTEGLSYLEHFEYECTEQLVSRFLPNALTYRALRLLGIEDPELEAKLIGLVAYGLDELADRQNADGGWGWWWGDRSNPHLTAYVVYGLLRVADAGFEVADVIIERGLERLIDELAPMREIDSPWDANRQAWLLYVLALGGETSTASEYAGALFEERAKLSHYGTALLAMALDEIGGVGSSLDVLVSDLVNDAILSATGAHWEEGSIDWWAMNTDTRSTAIILDALVQIDPENPMLPNVVRWLMVARRAGIWETTQETAWALIALTDWMTVTGELQGNYEMRVGLDEAPILIDSVTPETIRDPREVSVAGSELIFGATHLLSFARSAGEGRMYYTAHLTLGLPAADVEALDRGMQVQRTYVESIEEDEDGNQTIVERSAIAVGDTFEVRLTIVAPNDLYYVVVEDPIPAGCEAVDTSLATTSILEPNPGITREEDYPWWGWWWNWYSRSEFRDDKVVLFADYLAAGTYTYTYTLRGLVPGTYGVLPTMAHEFYFPEVFGRSDGRAFEVTEAGSD